MVCRVCMSAFSPSSILSCPCSTPDWRICFSTGFCTPSLLPAGPSEHYKRRGQDFKGGLHCPDSDGLGGVGGGRQTAPQVLKHLPMKHGRLCLPGDLMQPVTRTHTPVQNTHIHTRRGRCGEIRCKTRRSEKEGRHRREEKNTKRMKLVQVLVQKRRLVEKTKQNEY